MPCSTFATHPDLSSAALRLLKCLGHGSFSSVWLAEDLSHVPLTLLSKRSVKYLRRTSGKGRTKVVDNQEIECAYNSLSSDKRSQESNKRPPSRIRDGLRNMLSFSRGGSFTSTNNSASPNSSLMASSQTPIMIVSSPTDVDSLSRHPTLPSRHSPSQFTSNKDPVLDSVMSTLPSITPISQPFSSNQTISSSNLHLHLTIECGGTNAIVGSLSRDSSLRKFKARVNGTRPGLQIGKVYLDERDGEMGEPVKASGSVVDEFGFLQVGEERQLSRQPSLGKKSTKDWEKNDRLVAVKVTPRRINDVGSKNGNGCANAKEEEERTRVRFVREVEVLKVSWARFSHVFSPRIVSFIVSFDAIGQGRDLQDPEIHNSLPHRVHILLCFDTLNLFYNFTYI